MANPQLENGYTKIANEILEKLCKTNIGGEKRQVLDYIIRKTYGFNKRRDRISLSQISKGTGLTVRNVCRSLNNLKNMRIIIQIQSDDGNVLEMNKDVDDWVLSKLTDVKIDNCQKVSKGTVKSVPGVLSKLTDTKDNIQKKVTKDISELGSQVNEAIKCFDKINPSYEKFFSNKTQRSAMERLIRKHSLPNVVGFIKYLPIINADRYSKGKSVTPLELENNLAYIYAHYKSKKGINNSKYIQL